VCVCVHACERVRMNVLLIYLAFYVYKMFAEFWTWNAGALKVFYSRIVFRGRA